MRDDWDDAEAEALLARAGEDEADRALALRVYTSRLIGRQRDLVMHGGGNTSVKVERADRLGRRRRVLHVKGSGWDLARIEAAGMPGLWLEPLLEARALDALSDEDMVALQRGLLLDPNAPNPSVETLLHAFLPHAFIDHTHATAMLALACQPRAEELTRALFGDRVAVVPYIMPGFALAKLAAEVFEARPEVEGLLLLRHGHFTFGPDARTSYARMVAHVSTVEQAIGPITSHAPTPEPLEPARAMALLPRLRGALAPAGGPLPILDLRRTAATEVFFARDDVDALSRRGVATPDHVIRTKRLPLVVDEDEVGRGALPARVAAYREAYAEVFARQVARVGPRVMLEASPRVVWLAGVGVVGVGATAADAAVAADLAEQTLDVMVMAERLGAYTPVGEADTFDMEYWSLEQAKLGKATKQPLQGLVALVTGAGGAIGRATAEAFQRAGAALCLVDVDAAAVADAAARLGLPARAAIALDLTSRASARAAVEACVALHGGLDVLVSNAGAAWTGAIATVPDEALAASLALNLWAHHWVAQAAVEVMRAQGRGGSLLFNLSKQAMNPGPDFGPYGVAKAALVALMRQYALELGGEGIRANGVNADRIRSGLLTDDMITSRAAARGMSPGDYMAGNLLRREVTATDVADAFLALQLARATTGHVMTVDGGNVAAQLR